ncbi:chemotaxis protein CheB [uncultured Piscinibacter sp.]|uniref:chemotaxis protein CheB n=1 Tax=uncultured Piscinibacter sp. TaxID=1131835 RepID=UPI00262983CB|nr:chemotaxis protein CheB [uncultured Piscinibacter sp.]
MTDPTPSGTRATEPRTRIVGIGASAGGLEPLEQFLAQVPPGSGLAYVVVQHMDPHHKAMLSELLQRATAMPVHEVTESMRAQADRVYVIPPNAEITVAGGVFHLAEPSQPRGQRLPIDVLFSSLARDQGERAIGVVLSGMGSDGTQGLQAIQSLGGLTLAQSPESAQFDSMPRSAIAAGCADIVAPPGEMPGRILAVLGQHAPSELAAAAASAHGQDALGTILALLYEHTRHDLAAYKPSSLVRRIGRRMAVHGLETLDAYAAFLRENAHELDLLFKEVLIGVTAFFRDPEVWRELQDEVLPALLAGHAGDAGPLRAWVVGCSTGEEAYSLAMIFTEVVEASPAHRGRQLQVFATDLSADAIAVARSGHYPASIASNVPPARLARFFAEQAGGYQIDKRIREMVLFAQHDVILDPPFTRLDVLSCRNLLIYFGAALQQRLMPLFHYSLRPGGVLLLGASETVGRSQALFRPAHPKSRLYWRNDHGMAFGSVYFPTPRRPASRLATQETSLPHLNAPPANLQALADQWLLQSATPAAVMVNAAGDIVYINGRTGRYLEPAAGKANWNIHVMAQPGIRAQLAVALRSAFQDGATVELRGLRLDDASPGSVDITVQAIAQPRALQGMAMIVFRDVAATPSPRGRKHRTAGAVDPSLAEELARAREEISALRQEMHASQEALQAANEELQSTNEELQSANEELTTSKEEAQSMNEELQTINGELQSKLDDLSLAQSDMQNLLNSTDIATLFLDNELNVRRFTEQISRVVHLREGDIGRPLSELATTLIYPELHADVRETLRTLAFSQKEIPTTDGHWFSVRIMPYRTLANVIQGAVITFVDITVAKQLESRLREA